MNNVEAPVHFAEGAEARLPRVYADGVFDLFHLGIGYFNEYFYSCKSTTILTIFYLLRAHDLFK
jgi:hypothetical protein